MEITITSSLDLLFLLIELVVALGIVTIIHELGHIITYVLLERNVAFQLKLNWTGIDFYYTASRPLHTLLISLAGSLANGVTVVIFLQIIPPESYVIQLSYLMIFINLLPLAPDGKTIMKAINSMRKEQ